MPTGRWDVLVGSGNGVSLVRIIRAGMGLDA